MCISARPKFQKCLVQETLLRPLLVSHAGPPHIQGTQLGHSEIQIVKPYMQLYYIQRRVNVQRMLVTETLAVAP